MERFIHSCWLKTPPTQAPISLGSRIFRDKLKIVAAKEARFSIANHRLRDLGFAREKLRKQSF